MMKCDMREGAEAPVARKTICIHMGTVHLKITGMPPECAIIELEAAGASVSTVEVNYAEAIMGPQKDPVAFARALVANGWEWG